MIILILCIIFFILFIGNIYKFPQQEQKFQKKLLQQNKNIIFVNNPNLDIKEECHQPPSFFKMHNNGHDPCEKIPDFEYKHYATLRDYYL